MPLAGDQKQLDPSIMNFETACLRDTMIMEVCILVKFGAYLWDLWNGCLLTQYNLRAHWQIHLVSEDSYHMYAYVCVCV